MSGKTDDIVRMASAHKKLNLALGYLGLTLPVILYFGYVIKSGYLTKGTIYKGSISAYYYTNMRDFFVGYLFAISIVLMTYPGYNRRENILAWIAGGLALGVAFFPTKSPFETDLTFRVYVHYFSTFFFYFILAYFAFSLFPRHEKGTRSERRIKYYRILGAGTYISLFAIVITGIGVFFGSWDPWNGWTFAMEVITNTLFGLAWVIKGEGIWRFNDNNKLDTPLEKLGAFGNFVFLTSYILMVLHIVIFKII